MTSHVEQQIQARIAAVRRKAEQQKQVREELAKRRAAGLGKRHAQKLRNLAARGFELAPPTTFDNTTPAASGA